MVAGAYRPLRSSAAVASCLFLSVFLSYKMGSYLINLDSEYVTDSRVACGTLVFSFFLSLSWVLLSVVIAWVSARSGVRKSPVVGAVVGVIPNIVYWYNSFLIDHDRLFAKAVTAVGYLFAAPGEYLPGLWGEAMLLHHGHLPIAGRVENWVIFTSLNCCTWILLSTVVSTFAKRFLSRPHCPP